MVSKRLSREAGHRRKFLAIIDDTPECERAVAYASKRAKSTGGVLATPFGAIGDDPGIVADYDGDGRSDLVHDQVERMVERGDCRHDADGLAGGERPAPLRRPRPYSPLSGTG